ncbi:hypothetical protein NKH77_22000 [Streptomyces sp. M19]
MPHRDRRSRAASSHRRRGGKRTFGILAVVVLLAGGGYLGYRFLADDSEDPQVTAAQARFKAFSQAWRAGEVKKAAAYTDTPTGPSRS